MCYTFSSVTVTTCNMGFKNGKINSWQHFFNMHINNSDVEQLKL